MIREMKRKKPGGFRAGNFISWIFPNSSRELPLNHSSSLLRRDPRGRDGSCCGKNRKNFTNWIFPIISLSFHSTTAALSFVETLVVETGTCTREHLPHAIHGQCLHALYVSSVHVSGQHQNKYKYSSVHTGVHSGTKVSLVALEYSCTRVQPFRRRSQV
jgi:hypothetical protein